ncbi:MAG: MFS transporter [Nocardioidaceae bacterium]|nr:MAG: MFS transporter [Nocardioidaceae bacterium]
MSRSTSGPTSSRQSRLARVYQGTTVALRLPAYRRYFLGQQLGHIGQWIQILAEAWLAFEISDGSGTAVGVITAARFLPAFVLGPWIGLFVDRRAKRKALISAALLTILCAVTLGVLVAFDWVTLPILAILAFTAGAAVAVESTSRFAYVLEIAGYRNAGNTSALTGASYNFARIVGPIAGGALISLGRIELCFLVNAVIYLWVALTLFRMRLIADDAAPQARRKGQIREGFHYLAKHRQLRRTILLTGWVFVFANNFNVILPMLARDDLHGDASTFSYLMAALGIGALLGVPLAATRPHYGNRLVALATLAFGSSMVLASFAPGIVAMLLALALIGANELLLLTSSSTLVQVTSDPAMLGRVQALRGIVTQGATPLGAILTGFLVDLLDARAGLAIGGWG